MGDFAFTPPSLHPPGFINEKPQWARDFADDWSNSPCDIHVLLPCCGADAPTRAALELNVGWKSVGDWDLQPHLRDSLLLLGKDPNHLHLGPVTGDVTQVGVNGLPRQLATHGNLTS